MSALSPAMLLPVDGHVHFYEGHDLGRLLASASTAFARTPGGVAPRERNPRRETPETIPGASAATTEAGEPPKNSTDDFRGVLCLTEDLRHRTFTLLAEGRRQVPGWCISRTEERESLFVANAQGVRLLVLAGFQVVTREGIEVLALASGDRPTDRRPLADTVAGIAATGALPVLPWAFGKWWFGRGRCLRDYLARTSRPTVWLGDNAGRTAGLPGPDPFTLAARHGLVVLPGTDPLPLPGHEARAGRYGFLLSVALDAERPARAFREAVATLEASPPIHGARCDWPRFLGDQLGLRGGRGRLQGGGAETSDRTVGAEP